MPPPATRKLKPDFKPAPPPSPEPNRPQGARPSLAIPVCYLLLASVAVWVQGNKWSAFHRTQNLVALALALLALVVSATYLLRAFQARRKAGL